MSALPCVVPELVLSSNIAIVGSSGNLSSSDYGQEIDEFDDVIRFNRAPTSGFEKDVGSKTTLRVVNNHVFNNNDISKEGYTNQPKDFVRNLRNTRILYLAEDINPFANRATNTDKSNDLYLFDYETMPQIKKAFDSVGANNFTLGVATVCLLVLNKIKPVLFGIDIEPRARDHYWELRPPPSGYHDINYEQKLLVELEKQNLIEVKR
jgi:hypothetical protein|tara:strand:- start:3588 stop:4211 length:624 start_codon:yes stop_codon:yes gene_type:complete